MGVPNQPPTMFSDSRSSAGHEQQDKRQTYLGLSALPSIAHQPAAPVHSDVPVPAALADARPSRLGILVLSHAVTDFLSFIIIPLMTVLEGRAQFSHEQGALLLAVGS